MDIVLIHTTLDDETRSHELAQDLIRQKLAACVSVGAAVTSYYIWQQQEERALEYPLTIKTTTARMAAVKTFLRTHHPYQVPEIVCQVMNDADTDYAAWVCSQVEA